jgi:hypothetical protein
VPPLVFMAVMQTVEHVLAKLKASGDYSMPSGAMTVTEAFEKVGSAKWDDLRRRYAE